MTRKSKQWRPKSAGPGAAQAQHVQQMMKDRGSVWQMLVVTKESFSLLLLEEDDGDPLVWVILESVRQIRQQCRTSKRLSCRLCDHVFPDFSLPEAVVVFWTETDPDAAHWSYTHAYGYRVTCSVLCPDCARKSPMEIAHAHGGRILGYVHEESGTA